ncbi:hypothetical protein BR93DRAFT_549220 [Coniochaeta sp. PMI_546]|nr:hypothetical protein BR93DRAFT_549220 [Coniochaeta sp. PMI_546]
MANSDNGHVYEPDESFDWLVNHHRANFVQQVSSQLPSSYWARHLLLPSRGESKRLGGRTGFRVDFAELQRMRMRKLQIKLLRHVAAMVKDGKEPTDKETESASWENDLETYIKTVRDYDYMIGFAGTDDDPFVASSERRVDHKILEEEMNRAGITSTGTKFIPTGPWSPDDEPIWGRRYLGNVKNVWRRMFRRALALLAAYFFLLLPVTGIILATVVPDQRQSLAARLAPFIILVCFVALWGITMIATATNVKDVIPLTAGYTAVLGIILNGAAALRATIFPIPVSPTS